MATICTGMRTSSESVRGDRQITRDGQLALGCRGETLTSAMAGFGHFRIALISHAQFRIVSSKKTHVPDRQHARTYQIVVGAEHRTVGGKDYDVDIRHDAEVTNSLVKHLIIFNERLLREAGPFSVSRTMELLRSSRTISSIMAQSLKSPRAMTNFMTSLVPA